MRNFHSSTHPLRRTTALAMCAVLLLGSIPAFAVDDGVKPTYDEAYYAMTDYYGNLTDGSVVKSYTTNGAESLTDYGDYDEIVNLTNGLVPTTAAGKAVFQFAKDAIPDHFYFEGKTAKPFAQLPWTLAVHYTLNGVPTKAEDLAGKTGVVEINIDAIPNENASEYARNNYTLEAMAVFNQDDILSLEAPGAQVQLVGNLRAVLFIGLPGEECHFTIRVGSDDFSFGGMTFLMVPATLSQLSEIAKLSERKDELEDDYDKISSSLDVMLNALDGLSGSLYATAGGIDQLSKAQDTYLDGKDNIRGDVTALRGDLSNLADVLDPVESQITELSRTISESKALLASMASISSDLRAELMDLEDALEDLEDGTGDVKSVLRAAGTLQSSLNTLRRALGDTSSSVPSDPVVSPGAGTELRKLMRQVVQLHELYETQDEKAFFAGMLSLQGYSSSQAAQLYKLYTGVMQLQAAAAQYGAVGDTAKAEAYRAQADALIKENQSSWKSAQELHALFAAKESNMTFQSFCEAVLPQKYPDKSPEEIKQLAKLANDLWLVYASGDTTGATLSDELLTTYNSILDGESTYEVNVSSVQNTGGPEEACSTLSVVGGSSASSGSSSDSSSESSSGSSSGSSDSDSSSDSSEIGATGDSTDGSSGSDGENIDEDGNGSGSEGGETGEGGTEDQPNEKPNDAIVDLITSGIDSAASQINDIQSQLNNAMKTIVPPTNNVLRDLAYLCGELEDLIPMISDAEDLSSAVRGASSELRAILKDAESLQKVLDDYEPTLQETLKTVNALSTNAATTIRSTQKLIADTQDLMIAAGGDLDAGTKETLKGLSASLRAAAKSLSTMPDMKTAKSSISSIIEDTWNEYTGDVNNLLLMDANAEAVSLTDTRNDSPQSIQVLIRTKEIKKDDGAKAEIEVETAAQTTFWGRVAQMFRDFWAAITGIFKGKD